MFAVIYISEEKFEAVKLFTNLTSAMRQLFAWGSGRLLEHVPDHIKQPMFEQHKGTIRHKGYSIIHLREVEVHGDD